MRRLKPLRRRRFLTLTLSSRFLSATIKRPPCKFSELFRYTTKLELFMNAIGLICAIAAGVAQPACVFPCPRFSFSA